MKKIEKNVKKLCEGIREALDMAKIMLAHEAIKFIGKEFNTAKAWELKGEIQAMERVSKMLDDNEMWRYE